jgi:hypothetical protein
MTSLSARLIKISVQRAFSFWYPVFLFGNCDHLFNKIPDPIGIVRKLAVNRLMEGWF